MENGAVAGEINESASGQVVERDDALGVAGVVRQRDDGFWRDNGDGTESFVSAKEHPGWKRERGPGGNFVSSAPREICPVCQRPLWHITREGAGKRGGAAGPKVGDKRAIGGDVIVPKKPRTDWRAALTMKHLTDRDWHNYSYIPYPMTLEDIARLQTAFSKGLIYTQAASTVGWKGKPQGLDKCLKLSVTEGFPQGWRLRRQLVPTPAEKRAKRYTGVLPDITPPLLRKIDEMLWDGGLSLTAIAAVVRAMAPPEFGQSFKNEGRLRESVNRTGWQYQWIIVPGDVTREARSHDFKGDR